MKLLADGGELCRFLREFADLDWSRYQSRVVEIILKGGRVYRRDNSTRPPYTTVRFRDPNDKLIDGLKKAIDSYHGDIKWIMLAYQRVSFPDVNWVISPEFAVKAVERERKVRGIINPQEYMSERYPDFAPLAYADLLNLAKHVKLVLEGEFG